ncbi:MAG: polyamine aminopropyltransferase [Leptospira sp.]|nr:polyamine aminopropyltransferase [Leptospira sp.]
MELWLDEQLELKNGRAMKMRVVKTLDSIKTPFQQIDVFETQAFGKVFTLDGVIMMTESDEFSYHEMITHVPMMSHPNPEYVLVVGGGDGGTVREVLKHSSVKEVHLCEIDKGVVDISRKHFPAIAKAMSDKRVVHAYEDGAKYVKKNKKKFDVIICDSSDPIGPAEVLFREPFYRGMEGALRDIGICSTQAESFFYHGDIIKALFEFIPKVYKEYGYYYTTIPTYPSGIIGFTFLSNKVNPYKVEPDIKRLPKGLRYYSTELHKAAFVLPEFAKKFVKRSK